MGITMERIIPISTTLLVIFYMLTAPIAWAKEDDAKNYARAYKFCSPAAHKKTIEQCHYYKMVEDLYTSCMHQSGFQEDSDIIAGDNYKSYLKTHNICTNSANSSAQKICNYGDVYKEHYTSCMEELGFNSQGDSIKDNGAKPGQNLDNLKLKKNSQNDFGTGARKFFDLFF